MEKASMNLPSAINLAGMLEIKGGLGFTSNEEDPNNSDITIRCEPGPAVSCSPGNAIGR